MSNLLAMKRLGSSPSVAMLVIVLAAAFLRFYALSSVPPALFSDEAFEGYDAARVAQTGYLPVFFAGNNGREPLMAYLQAIGLVLWGAHPWVLRVVPGIVGLLAVPVIYRLGRELFKKEKYASWLGVLAAGMLAVSFWEISLSRFSVRAISLLLLSTLTIWAFWRAWQSLRWFDFASSGALLGLTLYTHIPSRGVPFVLLFFLIGVTVLPHLRRAPKIDQDGKRVWLGAALLFACAVVVFAPLGLYFFEYPGAFLQRAGSTAIFSGEWSGALANLGDNAIKVVRMFVDRGDLNPRHNIPGRPALELLTTIGFWIGIIIACRNITKPAYLLLLLWLSANLSMTWMSVDAPHFHRSLGAVAPSVVLAANGFIRLRERFRPRFNPAWMVVILVGLGGVQTYHDYFNLWGPSRETFYSFEGPTNIFVDHALEMSKTSDVMIPLQVFTTSQMQFALHGRFPRGIPTMPRMPQSNVWFLTDTVQRTNVIIGKDGIFMPQPLDDLKIARLKDIIKNGQQLDSPLGPLGVRQVRVENASEFIAPLQPARPIDANFDDQLRMLGYAVEPSTVKPGDKVRLIYYWQAMQTLNFDLIISTNLLNANGDSIGRHQSFPVLDNAPTSLWQAGFIIPDVLDIPVPADASDGKYRLEVGVLNLALSDLVVPLIGTEDRLSLDPITVSDKPVDAKAISHPLDVKLGDPVAITLLGYDSALTSQAGEQLSITLFWRADRALTKDYSVFVHLVDAAGNLRAQQDNAPQNGNAPTSWWRPGDLFADSFSLNLPVELEPGNYALEIGMYDPADGKRLPLFGSGLRRQSDDAWRIAIEVGR